MSQILESIKLALSSIWANKLRSLLTLLGNIVAVASIITVVALITGVNGAVSDAIVSDPEGWRAATQRGAFVKTLALGGDALKRAPTGFDPDPPLIDDLEMDAGPAIVAPPLRPRASASSDPLAPFMALSAEEKIALFT